MWSASVSSAPCHHAGVRVAVVHSFYRSDQPSGENIAVDQQMGALERDGIEVIPIFRYTDVESRRPLYRVRASFTMATGYDSRDIARSITGYNADAVIVHNTLPNIGNRWVRHRSVPLITMLHNFRASCANGLLFRDGRTCLACPTQGSLQAVRHRCYQDSLNASIPAAIATRGGASGNRLLQASDVIVAQSGRVREFMLAQGIPQSKLVLVPGFTEDRSGHPAAPPSPPRFLFVGRPTPEKGLTQLLEAWPDGYRLDVIGSDLLPSQAQAREIRARGRMSREETLRELRGYTALVFPGRAWEGAYPLVVREAFEAGVPVIARGGSGAADLVEAAQAGRIYDDGDPQSLRAALDWVTERNVDLRVAARRHFEGALTESRWVSAMRATIQRAIDSYPPPSR